MTGVNGRRVVLGGLVAGVVVLLCEMLFEPLAGARMEAWLSGLGLAAPGEAAMMGYAAAALVAGIVIVWLYAAARPRLGAGPGAALKIGLAAWVLACVVPSVGFLALGVLPADLFWITVLWAAVQIPAATLAGAWVYREEPAGAMAAATARAQV